MRWNYALFDTTSDGMLLSRTLRKVGVEHSICPTPRHLAESCGIALRFRPPLRQAVLDAATAMDVTTTIVEDLSDE